MTPLLDAASAGKLQNPVVLEQHVRRMLADPRADALVTNFVGQWLFLRNLPTVLPDPRRENDFDEDLRQGFRRETELFAGSILREDRSVLELLTATHTFVNERLAKHYGIPHIRGTHFRRVERTDRPPPRAARPGQRAGRDLVSASHVAGGSGKVGAREPARRAPASAAAGRAGARGEAQPRRRSEVDAGRASPQHRANPVCASCHATMDPLGLSLENFDMVGRWRDVDEALIPIDASGVLPDGTTVRGPGGPSRGALERSRSIRQDC